jgi:hypothetical protein
MLLYQTTYITMTCNAGEYLFCGALSLSAVWAFTGNRTARYNQNAFEGWVSDQIFRRAATNLPQDFLLPQV